MNNQVKLSDGFASNWILKLKNNIPTINIFLSIIVLMIFAAVLYGNAWLSDDSMITMRTVDNFVNRGNLRWNIIERVQAYTHPLWMFLLSSVFYFIKNPFITLYLLSFSFSIYNFIFISQKFSDEKGKILIIGALFIGCKSFIDFSTSGLANPLFFTLSTLFIWVMLHTENQHKIKYLSFLYSLIILTRIDLGLLFLPSFIAVYWKLPNIEKVKNLFWLFPIVGWELFSIFYYGFPFPNTAYAKINTSVSIQDKLQGGIYYFKYSLMNDPITIITILACILIVIIFKKKKMYPLIIGIILYLGYIIRIGGDFMGGRFFSVLFVVSAIIILEIYKSKNWQSNILLSLAILIFSLSEPLSPIHFFIETVIHGGSSIPTVASYEGIADEKVFYFPYTGLVNMNLITPSFTDFTYAERGIEIYDSEMYKEGNKNVVIVDSVGFTGYYFEDNVYIIDVMGLGDPLMARIPCLIEDNPRIGHFQRDVPNGYYHTRNFWSVNQINRIDNEDLYEYFDKLNIVIQGKLISYERLVEIYKFNTGQYDFYLDNYCASRK